MDGEALKRYQAFTATTAIYPILISALPYDHTDAEKFGPPMTNIFYTILGMCSEVGELLTAMELKADRHELIKELGDILWYVSETATMVSQSLVGIPWNPQPDVDEDGQPIVCDPYGQGAGVAMAEIAGKLAGIAKRKMRDNNSPDLRAAVTPHLARMLEWISFWAVALDVTMQYIADTNVKKLTSRQTRGVLTGEGDNR